MTAAQSAAARESIADRALTRDSPVANESPLTRPAMATASSIATRDVALLMPEASPARASATAVITVVVSGATLIAMPRLITSTAGRILVQYDPPSVTRTYRRNPTAATVGPTVSGSRAP